MKTETVSQAKTGDIIRRALSFRPFNESEKEKMLRAGFSHAMKCEALDILFFFKINLLSEMKQMQREGINKSEIIPLKKEIMKKKKSNSNQDMFLNLVKATAFPEMNCDRIIKDLMDNRSLWLACSVQKNDLWEEHEGGASTSMSAFMEQRGKEDTLSICSSNHDNDKLIELAKTWGADKVEWKKNRTDSEGELRSLELWWDRKLS